MNTTININIGQRIIIMDIDAHAQLSQYLQQLKNHFAKEESGDEIYGDIELRISDIMNAKLRTGAASITNADVREIIARIGTLEELGITEEASTASNTASQSTANSGTYSNLQNAGKQKLTRSEHEKILTGLCAGVARYLHIDPVWVRLATVFLAPFGIGIVLYVLFSIIVPKSVDAIYLSKRLMRDTTNKVIGGVCAGIAKYINVDVSGVRLTAVVATVILSVPGILNQTIHISGSLVLLYLLLWLIMPKASTASDRLQMQGIEPNAQNLQNQKLGAAMPAQVQQSSGCVGVISTAFKIFAWLFAAFLLVIFGAVFSGLFFGFGSLTLIADYLFRDGTQTIFAIASWVLLAGVPLFAIIYIIAKVIAGKRNDMGTMLKNLGLAWAAGWLCLIFLASIIKSDFSAKATSAPIQTIDSYNKQVLYIDRTDFEFENHNKHFSFFDLSYGFINDSIVTPLITLDIGSSTDNNFHVNTFTNAYGYDTTDALRNAKSAQYSVNLSDSVLQIPYFYSIKRGNLFRAQVAEIKLDIPEGKRIVFSDEALAMLVRNNGRTNIFGIEIIKNDNRLGSLEYNTVYEMRNGKLVEVGKINFDKDNDNINISGDINDARSDIEESLRDAQEDLNEAQNDLNNALNDIKIDVDSNDVREAQEELNAAKAEVQKINDALRDLQNKTFEKAQQVIDRKQQGLSDTL
jgi:phage shock protein PspC (stress-responsive transcriptional regulator)